MSGKPKLRGDLAALDLSGKGDEALWLISQGLMMSKVCVRLGVSRAALLDWLEQGPPERAAMAARAKKNGADVLVEEAHAIADGEMPLIDPETLELRPPDAQRDKLRMQIRQWTAERLDRDAWGSAQSQVTVNLNGLHLDALRAPTRADASVDALRSTRPRAISQADTIEMSDL